MKKPAFFAVILSAILLFATGFLLAQAPKNEKENKKEAHIESLIYAQHFSFEAQTALPFSMKSRQLTYGYELKVTKDTLDCHLPYFGRAYVAPITPSDGGIQFKTTDFKYSAVARKKGGWDITISPQNAGDTRQMTLYVSSAGYASLQVISNNRQPISFNGYIK
ncbi:MAG: DUF4251 domain-containing protein [Bacteroidetes bacterium]|nr:DUF4251 domain-containing protein [Bacteroidota bacterium]MBS1972834.1 DUF4251 domain-containing protein [Bacteroidota bacterium]